MTVQEALDLYPEVRDYADGRSRDYRGYPLLREAARIAALRGNLDPNTGRPALQVTADVLGALAEAHWQLKRGSGA